MSGGLPIERDAPSRCLSIIGAADQDSELSNPGVFLPPDTIYIGVGDGSGRLLSFDGDFYALSATSADMFRRLLQNPMESVLRELTRAYDAPEIRIKNDLRELLNQLQRRDLVFSEAAPDNARRKNPPAPSVILIPLLRCLWRLPVKRAGTIWWLLALARVACCLWGWSSSVACWRGFLEMWQPGRNDAVSVDRAAAIDASVRHSAARHLMGMGCKERALTCWFLLLRAGIPADLVLGVNLYPLASHCWCESGGQIYSDDVERCGRYEEILRYRVFKR